MLGPMLKGQEPDLQQIATRLQMPARTLRRKLAEEGSSYRAIMNDTRRDLAMAYIRDTESAFGEIAWLLGFSSAEAFQRAFKRWSGQTPGDYRARSGAAADQSTLRTRVRRRPRHCPDDHARRHAIPIAHPDSRPSRISSPAATSSQCSSISYRFMPGAYSPLVNLS